MREKVALLLVLLIVIGMPIGILVYQYKLRPAVSEARVIDIRAAAPEKGGFQPAALEVAAGETVTLRFHSVDVTHGIAIGPGLGVDLGQVDPGHVKEITLTFNEAGVYTFYCNTWCSTDHWRMRGVLTVHNPADPKFIPPVERDPVIEALMAEGVDIDANLHMDGMIDHPPQFQLEHTPSLERGTALAENLTIPAELRDSLWRRSHTPQDGLTLLGEQNPNTAQADLIDVVWYLWTADVHTLDLTAAQTLYAKNCAACHGETGGGDGIMADQTIPKPAAFADLNYMFTMRGDVLYAKIRRGGMGTDMPNFGTLLTQEETWQLVDYLWTLASKNN